MMLAWLFFLWHAILWCMQRMMGKIARGIAMSAFRHGVLCLSARNVMFFPGTLQVVVVGTMDSFE